MVFNEEDIILRMRRGRPGPVNDGITRHVRVDTNAMMATFADLVIRDPQELDLLHKHRALTEEGFETLKEVIAIRLADQRAASARRAALAVSHVATKAAEPLVQNKHHNTDPPLTKLETLENPGPFDKYKDSHPDLLLKFCGKVARERYELAFYDLVEDKKQFRQRGNLSPVAATVTKSEAYWLLFRFLFAGVWQTVTDYYFDLRRRGF